MDFLRSFLRRHFAGKPVVASLTSAVFRVSGSVSRQNILSSWKHAHWGVPQDTKLGVTLFLFSVFLLWSIDY